MSQIPLADLNAADKAGFVAALANVVEYSPWIAEKLAGQRPFTGINQLHTALMAAIHEVSREVLRVEEGSLYPALHRMEEAGWVRAEWTTNDTGRRARSYDLTAAGRKQLAAEESRWQAVTAAVNRVLRTV